MHGGTGGENMNEGKQEKDFWEVKCFSSESLNNSLSQLTESSVCDLFVNV